MRSFTGKKIQEKLAVRDGYVEVLLLMALETNVITQLV